MLSWFYRHSPRPNSTREMIRVLRAAAQFSDRDAERIEYNMAADALDRVITAAIRHSDAPTRDAFAYALGRAELDLGDKLTELIEITKETRLMVQEVQIAQIAQADALGVHERIFHAFDDALQDWRSVIDAWRANVDAWRSDVDTRLAGLAQARDESTADRKQLNARQDARDIGGSPGE